MSSIDNDTVTPFHCSPQVTPRTGNESLVTKAEDELVKGDMTKEANAVFQVRVEGTPAHAYVWVR